MAATLDTLVESKRELNGQILRERERDDDDDMYFRETKESKGDRSSIHCFHVFHNHQVYLSVSLLGL